MAGRKRNDKSKSDEILSQGGRIPPQAQDVEKYILGALLLDNEAVSIALEELQETDFYRDVHRIIFLAMVALYQNNEPIDLITVTDQLQKTEELEKIGGAHVLGELAAMVPSAANIEYHISLVKQKAVLRRLIHSCTDILSEAYDPQADVEGVLSGAQQRIFDLLKNQRERSYQGINEVLNETFQEIERLHHLDHTGIIGVPSGFMDLDKMTAGFHKGDLIILAGRPSMGKTAFCLNLARNAAISGAGVGIFSLEMSAMQLVQRMICSEAEIDAQRLRTGRLSDAEWPRLSRNAGRLADMPIYIDDTAGLDILKLSARSRRMALEKEIKLLIVDYLQLMDGPKGLDNRQQEISYISRSLKGLAKQLGIPIIALSQLSRAVESRPDKRPMLSDLRESGAIEQDADLVMFVYREEFYIRDHTEPRFKEVENKAEIVVGKHRNGAVGIINLAFRKNIARFENLAHEEDYQVGEESAPF
ncbi:MAG TPA: replicative DNA helicase [Calditrichia bacterium]|nr:replicative DNA helicase [Calditrichia bacterium]HQV31813.1 replicative DNA helicase [Calditrichia bacterium]